VWRLRVPSWLWLAAAAFLLLFPLRFWSKPVGRAMLSVAASPVERCNPQLGAAWRFLHSAGAYLPSGATYTVLAPTPEAEMEALMVAFGLLPDARPLPSSYYGRPLPELGGQAEYLLVLAGTPLKEGGTEPVAELEGGVVLRRRGGA
jgi:hypothetical protein